MKMWSIPWKHTPLLVLEMPHQKAIALSTLLSAPLRDRFGLVLRLDYYNEKEMEKIVERSSAILSLPITPEATKSIAIRSRRTPRIANRILKRARDVLEVHKHTIIDEKLLDNLFSLLEIDDRGLTDIDIQYLRLLAEKFQNTPVGVETIASSLSEDRQTVEEFIEPYLMQIGFIKKNKIRTLRVRPAKRHASFCLWRER